MSVRSAKRSRVKYLLLTIMITVAAFAALSGCGDPEGEGSGNDEEAGEELEKEKENENEDEKENIEIEEDPVSYVEEHARVELETTGAAPGEHFLLKINPFPYLPAKVSLQDNNFDGKVSHPLWDGETLYLILAASYHNEPGEYKVVLQLDKNSGDKGNTLETNLELETKDYPSQSINIPPGVGDNWTSDRLQEEREMVVAARSANTPHPLWCSSFDWPLEGEITSKYGAVRVLNDAPPRRHNGIDIAADTGTPIRAGARGKVILADSLLAQGKTVILDHGLGLNSSYLHLNEIGVAEGELVEKGEVIGTVGATGLATGAHLHWSVHLLNTPLNPEIFLDERNLWDSNLSCR